MLLICSAIVRATKALKFEGVKMQAKEVKLPLSNKEALLLHAGEIVSLFGTAYLARDAAHKRIAKSLELKEELPFELADACIFYAGPCPAAPGELIGPCGPTSSSRMDKYTLPLLDCGLSAMIGKGRRSHAVVEAMRGRAVYFAVTGGAALIISKHIVEVKEVAYPELGTEAVLKIKLNGLKAVVAVDAHCNDIFSCAEVKNERNC